MQIPDWKLGSERDFLWKIIALQQMKHFWDEMKMASNLRNILNTAEIYTLQGQTSQ